MDETQQAPWWDSFYKWGQPTQQQNPSWMPKAPGMSVPAAYEPYGSTPSWSWANNNGVPVDVNIAKPVGLDMSPAAITATAGGGYGTNPASQAGPITQWLRDQGILGTRDGQGWGGLAFGGAQALTSMYLGMKQYNLAKEALAASKSQFERNFANQVTNTNTALEDRQRARVASNANAYQSVGDYMNQHKVG